MKVLMINGSPRAAGNTAAALNEMKKIFEESGVETEIVSIGNKPIRGCIACGKCSQTGKCVFDDLVNETAPKFAECDGLVIASPVYYASANGSLVAFLDRLFYSSHFEKRMKVGASVAVARRAGTTATFDQLNKYFTAVCRWRHPITGTRSTAARPGKPKPTPKECKPCAPLCGIWRF